MGKCTTEARNISFIFTVIGSAEQVDALLRAEFPEVDRADWFTIEAARTVINSAQIAFLAFVALTAALAGAGASAEDGGQDSPGAFRELLRLSEEQETLVEHQAAMIVERIKRIDPRWDGTFIDTIPGDRVVKPKGTPRAPQKGPDGQEFLKRAAILGGILDAVDVIQGDMPIVFPIHPRTRKNLAALGLQRLGFLLGETRYLDAAERTLRAAWRAVASWRAAARR